MTKYEPHSCSKPVTAVKKISLVLKVSNSGLCWSLEYLEHPSDQTQRVHKSKWNVFKDVRNVSDLLGILGRWGQGW